VKRLIVNADDLGLHTGINAGILRGHREGIVTSASLSTNGAAFEDALRVLKGADGLGVGVHLTLVGENALSPPGRTPTLAPDGRLPVYFTALFRGLLLGQIRTAEIEAEIEAQVARARDAGVRIRHLDSHQHVHLHPSVLPIVVRVARRFGIGAVRAAPRLWPLHGLRPALLSLFARRAAHRLRRASFATPDTVVGTAETGRLTETSLLRLIGRLPVGTSELICHPGQGQRSLAAAYRWGFSWERETEALISPRVREALAREGIRLASYADL
jgi:hopanoid biosynthesis associated protein HpnK